MYKISNQQFLVLCETSENTLKILPDDLLCLIYLFASKLEENELIKIQRCFLKNMARENAVIDLILDHLPVDDFGIALVCDMNTKKIMHFCERVLSGKHNIEFWDNLLVNCIYNGLQADKDLIPFLTNDSIKNFNSNQHLFLQLYDRFNSQY